MKTIDLFMMTDPEGSFKYRMTCPVTGDQIIKQPIGNYKFAKSLGRILKYVARLNYSHFSQYSVPLTKMSATTYNKIKKNK